MTVSYEVIYAGKDRHEYRVGIITDMVIFVQLETKPKPIAYAPTTESSKEEIGRFYKDLKEVKRCTKNNDVVLTPKLAGIMVAKWKSK